jgi:hypothetical protein
MLKSDHWMKKLGVRQWVLLGFPFVLLFLIFSISPIPLPPEYHQFADQRSFLGISHTLDVLSNFGFLVVGILGIRFIKANTIPFKNSWLVFFGGVFLVAFGSSFYHLAPDHYRLVWDRLPMTLGFMGLFVGLISDVFHKSCEKFLLLPMNILGVGSVWYWYYTETIGLGDQRFYAWVQAMPLLFVLVTFMLFPKLLKVNKNFYFLLSFLLYFGAKVLEKFDEEIFEMSAYVISGHSLKHVVAAVATYLIYKRMVEVNSQTI